MRDLLKCITASLITTLSIFFCTSFAHAPLQQTLHVRVTAYCPCAECNTKRWENKSATHFLLTAWYHTLKAHNLEGCAVDNNVIPLGSLIIYNGKRYIAIDTGVKGKHVDVLVLHHNDTIAFGAYENQEIIVYYDTLLFYYVRQCLQNTSL